MRRPRKTSVALVLAVVASFNGVGRFAAKPKPAVKIDLTTVSTQDLIERFQKVSEQSVGADTMMVVEGFIALDSPLRFGGGVLGVPAPKVSPVMRELVRRGVAAVPALLDHLSDARPTKLIVGDSSFFTARWYGNEYDPKDPTRTDLPPGLKRAGNADSSEMEDFTIHRATVGDLCFVTLGQIVNRKLLAVRYQPSQCLVVNSPTKSPQLAAAAREDWKELTSEDFKAYLLRDLERIENNWSNMEVLQRLHFYFPQASVAAAVTLLNRPVYNLNPLNDLDNKLFATADEEEQDRLLAEIRVRCGEVAYQAAVQGLAITLGGPPPDEEIAKADPEIAIQYNNAIKLVNRRFPDANKNPGFSRLVVTCGEQLEVAETAASFHADEIDVALRGLLRRTLELQPDDPSDQHDQLALALACAQRLAVPTQLAKINRAGKPLISNLAMEKMRAQAPAGWDRRRVTLLQELAKLTSDTPKLAR